MKLLALPIVLLISCGVNPTSSSLKHEYGKLTREHPSAMINGCKITDYPEDSEKNRVLNRASRYLRNIAAEIIERTNEKMGDKSPFVKSIYTADKFCIKAQDTGIVNAFARLNTGDVIVELGIMELAENDAQIATFLSHEMAHLLKAHFPDVQVPDYAKEEFDKVFSKLSNVNEIAKQCYRPAAFAAVDDNALVKILPNNKDLKRMIAQTTQYRMIRFQQVISRSILPFTHISNCEFVFKKQKTLEKIFKLAEPKVGSFDGDTKNKFYQSKKKFFEVRNDSSIQGAFEEAHNIFESLNHVLKEGLPELSNWKEQESDEVGLELMHRADLDIKEAPKFWLQMMKFQNKTLINVLQMLSLERFLKEEAQHTLLTVTDTTTFTFLRWYLTKMFIDQTQRN